jgi:hypothetical protein
MTTQTVQESHPGTSRLWRPPLVGIITALLMLIGIALGHAVMVMIQNALGFDSTYLASIGIGLLAVVALWYGVKSRNESFATWTGFFSGLFVWMAWVEFFYMYYGRKNFGLMPRVQSGEIGAEPEYLIMSATVGVLLTMLVYHTFDKDTRCNMFVWIQDRLGLRAGLYRTEGLVYGRTGKTLDEYLAGTPGGDEWTFETLTDHIVTFCAARPDASVPAAVEDLWQRLNRPASASPAAAP